jgi:hypothetical protein
VERDVVKPRVPARRRSGGAWVEHDQRAIAGAQVHMVVTATELDQTDRVAPEREGAPSIDDIEVDGAIGEAIGRLLHIVDDILCLL